MRSEICLSIYRVITSDVTIDGNGSTIERDSGAAPFRIIAVTTDVNLTLQDTTVSGGVARQAESGGEVLDRVLQHIERGIFYMPLQHSEFLAPQDRSVEFYTVLT
jgi:hypothetical protein